ncbi:MAG: S1-like domain-containing RNA-binding protein [Marinifilaceae bacterium]
MMVEIGKYNNLEVVKDVDHGLYLDGGETYGEILIPNKYVFKETTVGDFIDVFVYYDTEDRIIATTEMPYAMVGEFACLKAIEVNNIGAFLDWGLIKDLFVPFREQKMNMQVNRYYVVHIDVDEKSKRIVGTAKFDKFLDNVPHEYQVDQEVDVMVAGISELGYTCIINGLHTGMLYMNEIFEKLHLGQKCTAYIKKLREDDKIDLYYHKKGLEGSEELSDIIMDRLDKNNGYMNIGDKSDSEDIYYEFAVSKKQFKKAIGHLYKQKLIKVEPTRIEKL